VVNYTLIDQNMKKYSNWWEWYGYPKPKEAVCLKQK